jgi:hypothetical protein
MLDQLPPKIQKNIAYFSGRSWLLTRVSDWFYNTQERMLILTGEPGTGKSMVAAWLAGSGPPPSDAGLEQLYTGLRDHIQAVHFFQFNARNTSPHALARNLADQLLDNLVGFSEALALSLDERVEIKARMQVGEMGASATATNLYIDKLEIDDLSDEISFDRLFHDPLQCWYKDQAAGPLVILLLDALDEAFLYNDGATLSLLASLDDLPDELRILATSRPDSRALASFAHVRMIDLVADAPDVGADIRGYVEDRLKGLQAGVRPAVAARKKLAEEIADHAGGYFLYAHLVTEDYLNALQKGGAPGHIKLPDGLSRYYHERLAREIKPNDRDRVGDVLGLISVGYGEGLSGTRLEKILQKDVEPALRLCEPYLDGSLSQGPFRPFHRSLAEFVLEDATNTNFHRDAYRMHQKVADYYLKLGNGKPAWYAWDEYGLRYVSTHLAGAARGGDTTDRHRYAERLTTLVGSDNYRKRFLAKLKDAAELQRQLGEAVRTAAQDPDEAAVAVLVKAMLQRDEFSTRGVSAKLVFDLAAGGDLEAATHNLAIFPLDPFWRKAAALLLAWLAVTEQAAAAGAALKRTMALEPIDPLLERLAGRVRAALNKEPPVVEAPLQIPPPDYVALILKRMEGKDEDSEMAYHLISGIQAFPSATPYEGLGVSGGISLDSDAAPMYLAQHDGGALVAYATVFREEGVQKLARYIDLLSNNPYVPYRRNSLLLVMDALLNYDDQEKTLALLRQLMISALSEEGTEYEQAAPQAVLGLRARAGQVEARDDLKLKLEEVLQSASELSEARGNSDIWATHKRSFAALAQVFARLIGGEDVSADCLACAFRIPGGFAGFQAPAWLNVAEALQVCGRDTPVLTWHALQEAQACAHNIQESVFCARTTAMVNAMRLRWWPLPSGEALADLVGRFVDNPADSHFTSLHLVGDRYALRGTGPLNMDLNGRLRQDQITPQELAKVYGHSLADLRAANHHRQWEDDTVLAKGAYTDVSEFLIAAKAQGWEPASWLEDPARLHVVHVPDPRFRSLLAARLAAGVVADGVLDLDRKRTLAQALIPLAEGDRTALDTVLARLLLLAPDDEYFMKDLLAAITPEAAG